MVIHEEFENKNVSFLNARGFWWFYALLLVGVRLFMLTLPMPQELATTLLHLAHCALTFYLMHWNKGSPVTADQGLYDKETFWEQIDSGEQFTWNRKLFTIVPVLVFLWASYDTNWRVEIMMTNAMALAIIIIAKSPLMHRVRILGINQD